MKVKATLYIQKTVWFEEEVEVEVNNSDDIDDAIMNAYDEWYEKVEDNNNPAVDYMLDDYGWEELDEQ